MLYILSLSIRKFYMYVKFHSKLEEVRSFKLELVCSVNACVYKIQAPPNARYPPSTCRHKINKNIAQGSI